MLISWCKKIVFALVLLMASIWIFTQVPWGQRLLQNAITKSLRLAGIDVTIDHIDVVLPLYIKFQGVRASDPSQNHATLFSCQQLIVTPLFFDLPFHQLSLLQLRGQGIFFDADAVSKMQASQDPWRFAITIPFFHLQSVHIKSSHLPNNEGAFDCSLKGKLSLSSDASRGKLSLSISKNTPCSWPKRLDLVLSKKQQKYSAAATVFLSTIGLDRPKGYLFGPDDQLSVQLSATAREEHSHLSFRSFDMIKGTWQLSCPMAEIPLYQNHRRPFTATAANSPTIAREENSEEYVLQRSTMAHGTVMCRPGHKALVQCDDLQAFVTVAKREQAFPDLDGTPSIPALQLELLRTVAIQGRGSVQLFSTEAQTVRAQLHIPQISINDMTGALDGTVDLVLNQSLLHLAATATGDVFQNSCHIPLHFAGRGDIGPESGSCSGDLVAQFFRISARYDLQGQHRTLWTTIRCQDLSVLQPFFTVPIEGDAELSSHILLGPKKSFFSLSGNVSDMRFHTTRCTNANCHLSFTTPSLHNIAMHASVHGYSGGSWSIDRGVVALSLQPLSHSLRLLEARAEGQYKHLPFDLFASGSGETDLKRGVLSIDRLEGKLGDEAIILEHPLVLEHAGLTLSSASLALGIGQEGRISGQWHRVSARQATGTVSLERVPLTSAGFADVSGMFDGQCHYQATATDVIASGQLQMHLSRLGVIGGPQGGIAIGGTFSVEQGMAAANVCIAGLGIKEPLMVSLAAPITRRDMSPFFVISPDTSLQGKVKGDIHLSELLTGWMPADAGFEAIIGCDIVVKGTIEDPWLSGPVHLREGRIDLLPTGEVISDVQMDGTIEHRFVSVDHIHATDDMNGTISGSGFLEIASDNAFRWQANIECQGLSVVSLDYATVIADATLKLMGDLSSITITGTGSAKKALIDLAARFPQTVPTIEVTYRDETPEPSSPYNVFFDLSIDAAKNLSIQGRGLSSSWDGHLHLGGSAEALNIEGLLHSLQGSFTLSNKDLTINEGTISVNGNLFKDSRLNVVAKIDLPSITAQVTLKGSLEIPKIAIQSMPPKPDNEILSLILFNKEYGDISPLQSLQLANTAMMLDHSSGPFDLLDKVKETFGIDVIDFGSSSPGIPQASSPSTGLDASDTGPPPPDLQSDVSLKVGKYISDGVAVTVSKNVTSNTNYLGLEAQVAPEVVVGAEVGDDQEGIVSLKWKRNY